ncbi:MAG: phosphoenolpyruvate--protein phosphotransferase, partial [Planctomycetia bacterium]|nr:phosphoenolpyruvate--protein phosphotransferase [Planctomycetia bacterium]
MGRTMEKFNGVAVSAGVAIARAFVLDDSGFVQTASHVDAERTDAELTRLHEAIRAALAGLEHDRESTAARLGDTIGNIFETHRVLLDNPTFIGEMESQIRDEQRSAEASVTAVCARYSRMLADIGNDRNALDIEDIRKRLLTQLAGVGSFLERLASLAPDAKVVILAHDLTPSETASLPLSHVLGFVTELGGPASHTAILATALSIPAVVGTSAFLNRVEQGDLIIVDGDQGQVILRPDAGTLSQYEQLLEESQDQAERRVARLRDQESRTLDNERVVLLANIEFPDEISAVLEYGAEGVGLYRTEFLYMGQNAIPDEEAHFQAYCELLKQLRDRPLTIRTFDLGADKVAGTLDLHMEREQNPNLGLRSIRLSLRCLDLFRTQLRAILRASAWDGRPHPNFRVMLPMVTSASEVRRARSILSDLKEDLHDQRIPYNEDLSLGIMVETPAAVVKLNHFCSRLAPRREDRFVRFLSIGTNDLVQYTLAVDRSNREVSDLYRESDPAVIQMIKRTVQWGARTGIPVSCCGQMAASPRFLMLLLGLGVRILSMPPRMIPRIKELVR